MSKLLFDVTENVAGWLGVNIPKCWHDTLAGQT